MIADVDTGGFPVIKLRLGEYNALTQRATAESSEEKERDPGSSLRNARIACWILAVAILVAAGILSGFHWSGVHMPTGLISWLAAFVTLAVIVEGKVQASLDRRRLTAEIRDNAPADAVELARIATLVARVAAEVTKLREDDTVHGRLDKLAELFTLSVTQSSRKAYTAGVIDALAAFEQLRRESSGQPDAAPAGEGQVVDPMDAELRGFLAGRMSREDPPGTEVGPVP